MPEKSLSQRLSFQGSQLFLDGKLLFTTPETNPSTRDINVVGVNEEQQVIDIGTGTCCYGYIHRLISNPKGEFRWENIRHVDFNVYDLFPVIDKSIKTDHPQLQAVLATGHGCAGAGVRLIDMYFPIVKEIVSAEAYREATPKGAERTLPRFLIINSEWICLDIGAVMRIPSKDRDPSKPIELHDTSDQTYIADHKGLDLNQRLKESGIDIEKTIEANENYVRLYRSR